MGKGRLNQRQGAAWLLKLSVIVFFLLAPIPQRPGFAEESLCAKVKIEIKQELTLERQAFDAHMRINNGLTHVSLENVKVDVLFTDDAGNGVLASSDPGNTDAVFFIRVDSMANIANVDGAGSVPANASADIHWLIIPAPGASNGLLQGTRYNVGAKLAYTIGGEENVTEVTPDYIFVKPMPELTLDYFLPSDVYGDDAFTPEIEPSIPFSLGVRVKNNGSGVARDLKIDSAQPRIVENEQGLLINFVIEGSEVNGGAVRESLLVDFGDIVPHTAGVARWIMRCTLSGQFVNFEARFSHGDELGGELTSLIAGINTHFLVQDVRVDLPGRDDVRDFLARDGDVYRVYESDSQDVAVSDTSESASLQPAGETGSQSRHTLSCPATAGFVLVQLADPHAGNKALLGAVRSDGKQIKPENVWLSKKRNRDDHTWMYFVSLFDVNTTGIYTLLFEDMAARPQPPVLQLIPNRSGIEGSTLSFLVEASDPNRTLPNLSAAPLPAGARFTDNKDGSGVFSWTPAVGQKGIYYITFTASDGLLSATQRAIITIFDIGDTDKDGMLDAWERLHFGTLDRDGAGDFDGDGISDLQEFLDGTDPTQNASAPSAPKPLYPSANEDVTTPAPELVVENSTDRQADDMTYDFEIYADPQMTDLVTRESGVSEGDRIAMRGVRQLLADNSADPPLPAARKATAWAVPRSLPDNSRYYWRVRSTDGGGYSLWAYWDFFVNTANDPPRAFRAAAPADGGQVDILTPVLSVSNSRDIDQNEVSYDFEVYTDSALTTLVASVADIAEGSGGTTGWTVSPALQNGVRYYWRALAADDHGAQTASPVTSFVVNTANHAPTAPVIVSPVTEIEVETLSALLTAGNAADADNEAIHYIFELDTLPTFDGPEKASSEPIPQGAGTTAWPVSNLKENTAYHWRVRATDGAADSPWAVSRFFVNRINEAPGTPSLKNPGIGAWVETRTPALSINSTTDPDGDSLTYQFEVYSDPGLKKFVAAGEKPAGEWTIPLNLRNNIRYYWRARAMDVHGVAGNWTQPADFFVSLHLVNASPELTFTAPASNLLTNAAAVDLSWSDTDPDSAAVISLYYDTGTQQNGTLIVAGLEEDPDDVGDSYRWDVAQVVDGTYHIYAVIADMDTAATVYCPALITLDRRAPVVTATPPAGSYATAQSVALLADETADIHFTLDGTEPTVDSTLYTAPVQISESANLRFMAVDRAGNRSAVQSQAYAIGSAGITVHVATGKGTSLSGVRVYAFKASGAYTGKSATTAQNGAAAFIPEDFPDGTYKFRIDYLGNQFWSASVSLPATRYVAVSIPVETANISVSTASGPSTGTRVYLFSATGAYLNRYLETDATGLVSFELPVGIGFKFRADILGNSYWAQTEIAGGGVNTVALAAGGGVFQVTLKENDQVPLAGIRMYLFGETGSYLGKSQTSDAAGAVAFEVPEGTYKVRADYLGYKFWTDPVRVVTDTTVEQSLPHTEVTLTVSGLYNGGATPLQDLKVYLFTPEASYLGWNETTDAGGQVRFSLPHAAYKVRVDYLGREFWSEAFTGENATVAIPMADAQVTVCGGGLPQAGVRVYLFSVTGAYLNRYETTDTAGQVIFRIPEGAYKFRADYQSSQFWSAEALLTANEFNPVTVSVGGGGFTFSVYQGDNLPLTGVRCHVFNAAGSYTGVYGVTDGQGRVRFELANGTYTFRVDYLGHQFFSDPAVLPNVMTASMTIGHAVTEVSVTTTNGPVPEARVYLFSETGTYLGYYRETDADGVTSFNLPAGHAFKFRADILGNAYWSDVASVQAGGVNSVSLDAGGGLFEITLQEDAQLPIPDIKLYLFSAAGNYPGRYETTDAQGRAAFEIPRGDYKVRVDHRGYSFWSETATITADTHIFLTIPHRNVPITVTGLFQGTSAALPGLKTYLFSPTGAYLGESRVTDNAGVVSYHLPQKAYICRIDFMGRQFWTDPLSWEPLTAHIPMAEAELRVTGAGLPKENVKVYAFSPTGEYLGRNETTDPGGLVTFRLPAGSYTFRADYQGSQFWSTAETLVADEFNPVIISVGGGGFVFSVLKGAGEPLTGARTYVFNASGSYLGLQGGTDGTGRVGFDLADGSYKFRVDYLGYSFWSDVFTVPATLSGSLFMDHREVMIRLSGACPASHALPGVPLYLFTPAGAYVGEKRISDENGLATLFLPDMRFMIRADYLGESYWSAPFQQQDPVLIVAEGVAEIHVQKSGENVTGARVYLFSDTGTYLGKYETTAAEGTAGFRLPEARSYKFRIDVDGRQTWVDVADVVSGELRPVPVVLE
ncbi:MAG: chitobiase/beta-hexosaminidase C-terminal domain-containing protein [Pseudomonadota bacterium]